MNEYLSLNITGNGGKGEFLGPLVDLTVVQRIGEKSILLQNNNSNNNKKYIIINNNNYGKKRGEGKEGIKDTSIYDQPPLQ